LCRTYVDLPGSGANCCQQDDDPQADQFAYQYNCLFGLDLARGQPQIVT
jgi:hypothetical protein